MPVEATEDQMLAWLWRHFAAQSWIGIPQVTVAMNDLSWNGVGSRGTRNWELLHAGGSAEDHKDRRIDLLLARKAPNPEKYGPLETLAVEVKVTRADFQSDVRNPDKQAPWRSAASRHVYAVPAGLVQADECPAGSGLLWLRPPAYKGGMATVEWVVRAPSIPDHKPPLPFRVLLNMLHRVSAHEAVTRGWAEPTPGERTAEDLRGELVAARKALGKAERALEVAEGKAASWQKAFALSGGGVPCGGCGQPLKPLRPKAGGFSSWRHVNAADTDPCAAAQVTRLEQAARDAYDAASDTEREREVRYAHRYGFKVDVETQPWRAFLPADVRANTWKPDFEPADTVEDDEAVTA
jgi:hypothetical protein